MLKFEKKRNKVAEPSRLILSASITGIPFSWNILLTALLPLAIPPVNPTRNIGSNLRSFFSKKCKNFRTRLKNPETNSKSWNPPLFVFRNSFFLKLDFLFPEKFNFFLKFSRNFLEFFLTCTAIYLNVSRMLPELNFPGFKFHVSVF